MKVLIINHCAHNRGDNGVLAFEILKLQKVSDIAITVSTSSNDLADWCNNEGIDVVCWSAGKRFLPASAGFFSKARNKLSNLWAKYFVFRRLLLADPTKYSYTDVLKKFARYLDNGFVQALSATDIVIGTGGHHISTVLDEDGINNQVFDMYLAAKSGKVLGLWSQSIGPLPSQKKYCATVRYILGRATRVVLRDQRSLEVSTQLLQRGNYNLCTDSVFGLRVHFSGAEKATRMASNRAIICLYTAQFSNISTASQYLKSIACAADYLVDAGYEIDFVPMQYKDQPGDERPYIRVVQEKMRHRDRSVLVDADESPMFLFRRFASADIVIGHKTHSIVYALAAATPVIAISYHPKTDQFMELFDQLEFVLPDENLTGEKLCKKIDVLLSKKEPVKRRLVEIADGVSQNVNDHFASFLSTLISECGLQGKKCAPIQTQKLNV